MLGGLAQLVLSGPVLLAMPVAAAAGAVTFLSPCCLPLVPGYLSYVTGMSGSAPDTANEDRGHYQQAIEGGGIATAVTEKPKSHGSVMLGALLFVLGFSTLFSIEGVAVSSVGDALISEQQVISRVLGCAIIVLGLMFMGILSRFTISGRIIRLSYRPRAGLAGAPLLGFMFGLAWTPCSGPTLTAVMALGENSGTALRGGLLAFTYALGIGIPFLMMAAALHRGVHLFGFAKRHARLITQIGGLMLITVGVLEVTGLWAVAIIWLKVHWLVSYTSPI